MDALWQTAENVTKRVDKEWNMHAGWQKKSALHQDSLKLKIWLI